MKAVPPYVLALVGLIVLCLAVGSLGYVLSAMILGADRTPRALDSSTSSAEDDGTIGRVMGVEGSAYVDDTAGKRRSASVGSSVHYGETLVTMQKSKLYITFEDRSALFLGEKSRMVIDEYVYKPDRKFEANCAMRLVRGVCRVLSGKIVEMNPRRFNIRTRMATIGIRGCEIGIRYSPGMDLIYMLTIPDGKEIEVSALADSGASVDEVLQVSEEETLVTVSRDSPVKRREMDPGELVALVEETTVGLAGLSGSGGRIVPSGGSPGQAGFYEIFERDSGASLKLKMASPNVPIESWGKWLHVDKIVYRLKLPEDVGVFVKAAAHALANGALRADNLPGMLADGQLKVVFDDHDRADDAVGAPDQFVERWRAQKKLYSEMFKGQTNILESQRLADEVVLETGEKWLRVKEIVYSVPLPEPIGVLVKHEEVSGQQGHVTVDSLLDLLMRGAVVTVPDEREDMLKPVVEPGDGKIREVTFQYLEVIYDGGIVEIPVSVDVPDGMPPDEWERIVIGSSVDIGGDEPGDGPGILYKPGEEPDPGPGPGPGPGPRPRPRPVPPTPVSP